MKPSTLIVMSVGLLITVAGFLTCIFAMNEAEAKYPNDSIFAFENENFEKIDGDTIRTVDFSDMITIYTEEEIKEVTQDVKVLSVSLSDVKNVEIVGNQASSKVMMYNFRSGLHACEISAGVITVTNIFQEAMIFDYLSDILADFHGLRKYIGQNNIAPNAEKKVVVYINDADILNRIDLDLTNCENVTVKNLTCSLDCKVVLNNSSIVFENCTFKDQEIIYPEGYDPNAGGTPSNSPTDEETDSSVSPEEEGNENTSDGEKPLEPIIINHYLTVDLNMKNGSSFKSSNCKFSSFTGLVNKKIITERDITAEDSIYTEDMLGAIISSEGTLCTLELDFTTVGLLYGFSIENIPDEKYRVENTGKTVINDIEQPEKFLENAESKDYPQVSINASNCNIIIKN